MEAGAQPPAGWYPDPEAPGSQRYWDGRSWTEHRAPAAGQQVAGPGAGQQVAAAPAAQYQQAGVAPGLAPISLNPYDQGFNVASLPQAQREQYMRHQLTEFPSWAVVVLSIVTLGIFGVIYHGLKHSKLPHVKSDDFTAGKGIGFLFIPFYNFYWIFVFWLRLADRINFQYRLRGRPGPVSRDLTLWTIIIGLSVGIVGITIFAYPVMACIVAAQIQSAANELAREGTQYGAGGQALPQSAGAPREPAPTQVESPQPPPGGAR
jgi:hypothetical protein